jgi:hypothetical protein
LSARWNQSLRHNEGKSTEYAKNHKPVEEMTRAEIDYELAHFEELNIEWIPKRHAASHASHQLEMSILYLILILLDIYAGIGLLLWLFVWAIPSSAPFTGIVADKEQVERYNLPVIEKRDRRYNDGHPHEAVED